jgi:hypothetical protein
MLQYDVVDFPLAGRTDNLGEGQLNGHALFVSI